MTTEQQTVMQRIAKLHAHAESAQQMGNAEEAATFMGKVQQMLEEHAVELDDALRSGAAQERDPMEAEWVWGIPTKWRAIELWEMVLAEEVARACGCSKLVGTMSNRVFMVGRRSNRLVADYLLTTLYRSAVKRSRAAQSRYQRERAIVGARGTAGYRAAWLLSFAMTITRRVEERIVAGQSRGVGLVRRQREEADAEAELHVNGEPVTPRTPGFNNVRGRQDGEAEGLSVDLQPDGLAEGAGQRAPMLA